MVNTAKNFLITLNNLQNMNLKLLQTEKAAEATSDLIGDKNANKITKISKYLETVTNENDKEIPKGKYVTPKKEKSLLMI